MDIFKAIPPLEKKAIEEALECGKKEEAYTHKSVMKEVRAGIPI